MFLIILNTFLPSFSAKVASKICVNYVAAVVSRSQIFLKIGLFKNSQYSQENTSVGVCFNKVAGL